ncbi:GNAT family N-acetyltransferase [Sagittula sp. NFXS13]|uniref:GNAT family N-acetyltransferase n=1 Tax=Sagittula sp. NFXS13 TaxID=2819095 RepID=UPI0032DE2D5F
MSQALKTRSYPLLNPTFDMSEDQVDKVLTAAFETDPPVRWMYPEQTEYLRHFPTFLRAFGGVAIRDETSEFVEGGAALWIAPGSAPDDEAIMAVVEASVPASRHEDVFAVFEAMGHTHPKEPHWYLPVMGVAPERQGRGLGTALMRPVLERCDTTGSIAYLEATTERSRALYARLGFEQTGTIRAADCPPIYPMVRQPR